VTLRHPKHGHAVVRENRPVRPELLERCLEGISVANWFRVLNGKVFFWVGRERASRLVGARAHRGRAHDVLIVNTGPLIARHRERIRATSINTGAVLFPRAPKRGRFTFKTLDERDPAPRVVELTVEHAVPDIEALTIRVERWQAGSPPAVIWSS
jgi:Family of unknown function (DUF7002)